MHIRPEQPQEFAALYAFVEEAFKTAKVADGDEQDFVDRLRAGQGYIPGLALVAKDGGRIVGHTMLTRICVRNAREARPFLLLAPLTVALERRGEGIGARLVREGFARARLAGHRRVLVVGDPAYYGRFGFGPASASGIANTNGIEDPNIMVCALVPGALTDAGGVVTLPE